MSSFMIDNDGGSDDIAAFFSMASREDVTIEAITIAGTGLVHGKQGALNFARLCAMMDMPEVPIAYGQPNLIGDHGIKFLEHTHTLTNNLLVGTDVPENPHAKITDSAVDLMKSVLEKSTEKVTILATGPLTNIAQLLQKHSNLSHKINKIVIMGGAINVPGNVQPLIPQSKNTEGECNIAADPAAAQIVFNSGVPITLVPLDATDQVPLTQEYYDALGTSDDPVFQVIFKSLEAVVKAYNMDLFLKHFKLWDALAAMISVNPGLCKTEAMKIEVDPKSGKTTEIKDCEASKRNVHVAMKVLEPETILDKLCEGIACRP